MECCHPGNAADSACLGASEETESDVGGCTATSSTATASADDDLFFIWICNECGHWRNCRHFQEFKHDLSNFGVLKWSCNDPSDCCVFLDLNIKIKGSRIITSTYQKPMNLYLYLPAASAHPRGMIKGVIYGLLRRYREQNTYYSDYVRFAKLLYRRLLARGWQWKDIKPIFTDAHRRICQPTVDSTTNAVVIPTKRERQLFLHLEYHPNGIPRHVVRQLYDKHCHQFERLLGVKPPIIAYTRLPNLGDKATKAKLHEAPGKPASFYLGEHRSREHR